MLNPKIVCKFNAEKQLAHITYYFVDGTKTTVPAHDLPDELKNELIILSYETRNSDRNDYRRNLKTIPFDDCCYIENNAPHLDENLVRFETHKYFEIALKKLPPDQHDLLYEIYFLKTPAAEIARRENVTKYAISHRLGRAKKALRKQLEILDYFDSAA